LMMMGASETKRYHAALDAAEARGLPIIRPPKSEEDADSAEYRAVRERRRDAAKASYKRTVRNANKISRVGQHTEGGLACPRCGGTQFKAKRSVKGKVAAGLLAPKSQVRCVTCGAVFKRG
jgi:hypothetical protein